jgi:Poly(hydroxyalcanoate) granule associated protein (phasin)
MVVKEAMMVTKTKAPTAKRSAPRKRVAAPAEPVVETTPEPGKPNLIRAGLQALDKARQDVAQRQSRVFEAILGLEPAQGLGAREGTAAKLAAEAFGLRKFEAVFDQRVAHALERMGVPSADALKALVDEVAALKEEVRSLKAAARRR